MAGQLTLSTPLGQNAFLLEGFSGTEALSRLFTYDLDLLAPSGQAVPFEALLGQELTVGLTITGRAPRYFSGICSSFAEGARNRDGTTRYRAELVPQAWLLTKTHDSRIFQELSVPDILQRVLSGIDVTFALEGTFEPRNYCVQYRESDFDFASRLMEEEGIFYFFKHDAGGHHLVVGNSPDAHPDIADTAVFDPTGRSGGVSDWLKTQTLTAGKVTLRDSNFQLPDDDLETHATIQDTVTAGQVIHHLALPGNTNLELYDYPGGYAQRFDGVDPGGGDDPSELQKIFADADRTSAIRMQAEAAGALAIDGASALPGFTGGHRFALSGHFDADDRYVLSEVQHSISVADPRNGKFTYSNTFRCLPASLPYRPSRSTPKPTVDGHQTAVVVGPAGEEIFTDKYGRVKVQFHWDREGKKDANSSCWIRVAQPPEPGTTIAPRIGWEVIVDFEEGDPDRPIITGTVFNASHPPHRPPLPSG